MNRIFIYHDDSLSFKWKLSLFTLNWEKCVLCVLLSIPLSLIISVCPTFSLSRPFLHHQLTKLSFRARRDIRLWVATKQLEQIWIKLIYLFLFLFVKSCSNMGFGRTFCFLVDQCLQCSHIIMQEYRELYVMLLNDKKKI